MNLRFHAFAALRMLLILTLLCGGLYAMAVTGLARLFFPVRSRGSLLVSNGRITASRLLAYENAGAAYFQFRPSASGYSALPGSAANFAPSSAAWQDSLGARRSRFIQENGLSDTTRVPVEMLCASGSGLDPHITAEAAHMQVARIVASRGGGEPEKQHLHELIDRAARRRWNMLRGRPLVNVCELNFILDNTGGFTILRREEP
jgi:K+-transporting ATPase ATPase C chain